MSSKKKDLKRLVKDDELVLSRDILNDDGDEIDWWEALNDSNLYDYEKDEYYGENDIYDDYETKEQDWVNDWIKNN